MAELVSIKRNVDVSPGQAAPAVFHCSQGDVGSKIILGLLNNGTAYSIPSGVTVTIEGSESNGSIFTPISATASGSDITFYLTGEMTAVAGPAICQAVLKSGSNILGTANFTLEVESSPMGADAPPVFTDAGWTWMLNKLNTEFVPALGNETIIDAIDSKADQSDLTALSNTVAGHTGSITVLNNSIGTINDSIVENRQNIDKKLDKDQGTANAGKYLKVQSSGQVVPVDLIDDSLLVETMAADSKATGDALNTKLNKNQGANNSGKYLKVGTDGNIETADLDVTTDKTLSIADKAADAKAVGDELTDLKADLNKLPFNDVTSESGMTDTSLMYRMDGFIYYYDNANNTWKRVGSGGGGSSTDNALPILYLVGDVSQMSKDVRSQLQYTFVDSANHTQRAGWCDAKWQGDSSLSYPKKNYTFRFYHDPSFDRKDKINYFDLTKQSKWVTKANWIDHSQARNIVSARLWSAIVHSRVSAPPELLTASPNNGAIDGEPIVIYLNGSYLGLYTMNIPKDDFTFGMDADNPLHCCAYGNKNTDGSNVFRTASVNGWDNEVPEEWTESTQNGLITLINFVMNSSDADFKANLNTYLDVESAIDYYLFCYFIGASDSLVVNQILLTYDGGSKWYYSAYDLDSTWGLYWNGSKFYPYDMACPEDYQNLGTGYNLLFQRLETVFGNELYTRYRKLRASVLSLDYINREFEYFMGQIPQEAYDDDILKWTNIPQKNVDHLNQIETWIANRAEYVDEQIADLASPVPCTGISLSETSLSFTDFGMHQLVASVQPEDCTQAVRWSSSDETVATVNQNGLVTLLANGTTTITATCGSYSATCAITMAYDEYGWSSLPQYEIDASTGEVTSGQLYKSKPIPVKQGVWVLQNATGSNFNYLKVAVYDSDDNFIYVFKPSSGIVASEYADIFSDDYYVVLFAHPNAPNVSPSQYLSFTKTSEVWGSYNVYKMNEQTGEVSQYSSSNNNVTVVNIPVDSGATYVFTASLTWKNIFQYAEDGTYIKCETTTGTNTNKTATMANNTAYVRLSGIGSIANAKAYTFVKQ